MPPGIPPPKIYWEIYNKIYIQYRTKVKGSECLEERGERV